jgi:hypothetical protein
MSKSEVLLSGVVGILLTRAGALIAASGFAGRQADESARLMLSGQVIVGFEVAAQFSRS